jgi:hypothetical protein
VVDWPGWPTVAAVAAVAVVAAVAAVATVAAIGLEVEEEAAFDVELDRPFCGVISDRQMKAKCSDKNNCSKEQ